MLGIVTTAVMYVGRVVAVPSLALRPLLSISLLMALGFFSHPHGFIMVIVGQAGEAVVKDALPASPPRFVIYRGLC